MINQALTTIEEQLRAHLGSGVDVRQHPGLFTDEELAQTILKPKSVRVSVEDLPALSVDGTGLRSGVLDFTVFVLCADHRGEDRHVVAHELVEQLIAFLPFQRWEAPQAFQAIVPDQISAQNLYSGATSNGKGIAWWAIRWTQAVRETQ